MKRVKATELAETMKIDWYELEEHINDVIYCHPFPKFIEDHFELTEDGLDWNITSPGMALIVLSMDTDQGRAFRQKYIEVACGLIKPEEVHQ